MITGKFAKEKIANISGWIRENQDVLISEEVLSKLAELRTPLFVEKAEKLLLYLVAKFPEPGTKFSYSSPTGKLEFQAAAWALNTTELDFIVQNYLVETRKFLLFETGFIITPDGWTYLDSLRRGNPQSHIGFIAMWFSDEVKPAWLAMDKAIRIAGYSPLRIDQKQHNNKIDDEIVAGIRRSKFLVADFTGQRGGVYFEAGLAMGLGLQVIWLCRHDDLKKVHFDTRQYNFILWEADKLDELTKALRNRIEATIGKGPIIDQAAGSA